MPFITTRPGHSLISAIAASELLTGVVPDQDTLWTAVKALIRASNPQLLASASLPVPDLSRICSSGGRTERQMLEAVVKLRESRHAGAFRRKLSEVSSWCKEHPQTPVEEALLREYQQAQHDLVHTWVRAPRTGVAQLAFTTAITAPLSLILPPLAGFLSALGVGVSAEVLKVALRSRDQDWFFFVQENLTIPLSGPGTGGRSIWGEWTGPS
jgi:hypothetical protein